MSINKITPYSIQPAYLKPQDNSKKKTVSFNIEQSDSIKYMIGSVALASFAAYKILNNKKTFGKNFQKLLKNGKNTCIEISKLEGEAKTNKLKEYLYCKDLNEIYCTKDYEPETGRILKNTYYYHYFDDKHNAVSSIRDYDKETGNVVKITYFYPDGKNLFYIRDYDAVTGNLKKDTLFYTNGNVSKVTEYDSKLVGMDEDTYGSGDEKDISYFRVMVTDVYKKLKETLFDIDGKTVLEEHKYL